MDCIMSTRGQFRAEMEPGPREPQGRGFPGPGARRDGGCVRYTVTSGREGASEARSQPGDGAQLGPGPRREVMSPPLCAGGEGS
jgi:hypothetical protein